MLRFSNFGKWVLRIIAAVSVFLIIFGIVSTKNPSACLDEAVRSLRVRKSSFFGDSEENQIQESLPFHPFENKCKFPLQNAYAKDIVDEQYSERLRTLTCPITSVTLASLDDDGYLYIHPLYVAKTAKWKNLKCEVHIFEGGLRNATTNKGKDDYKTVAIHQPPLNRRLFVNADAYFVKCFAGAQNVWEKPFAGMRSFEMEPNTVMVIPETPGFDKYGIRNRNKPNVRSDRMSIDILGFDSTSRTMFQRHMPRSWETMNRLGYDILYGYTKVGDNSLINLAPILAGDVPEAMAEPMTDNSGDFNKNWYLPYTKKLDPTPIPFLWKLMKEKFGCRSMFNEDISHRSLGLFMYPSFRFKPGFTESPADYYYRAYYLAVYKDWKFGPCLNGGQIQREFLNLWHRFANKYRDICHFGFTFITTLSHDVPMQLELLDEDLANKLESHHSRGLFDNSVSIILGDHGNRVGRIQHTYTGRIEERMPLMAIRIPDWFKRNYPVQYENFRRNKYKLTSNFDVHQMLKDIVLMDFDNRKDSGRGTSLFKEIPEDRTCRAAYIPENFCTCMIDRSNLQQPLKNVEMKSASYLRTKFWQATREWTTKKSLTSCYTTSELPPEDDFTTFGINAYARHGLRSKENVTVNEMAMKKPPEMNFLYHEMEMVVTVPSLEQTLRLLWRFDNYVSVDDVQVNFEPLVLNPPSNCPYKSIFDVCECLGVHH